MNQNQIPLCIDLDGTLSLSDSLLESFCGLLKVAPLSIFKIPVWLLKGRANLKRQIASRVRPDFKLLPLNEEVLDYIRDVKRQGRRLILVTAADRQVGAAMQERLGLFDEVMTTLVHINLSGVNKAAALVERFGSRGFDYIGNSSVDLPVWAAARIGYVVSPSKKLVAKARSVASIERVFVTQNSTMKSWLRALRVHQWAKNLLLLVPLAGAHQWSDPVRLTSTLIGMVAFSICASSVYLLNDLLDLESDRQHPSKRLRPFASGEIPILQGLLAVPLLVFLSASLAFCLNPKFAAVLAVYYMMTLMYSLWFKQVGLLDVLVLAGMYALRILAGGYVASVMVSDWLLLFSIFLFLSLAFLKRFTELRLNYCEVDSGGIKGRGYLHEDAELISSMGVCCGYLSVLVLGMYVTHPAVIEIYHIPRVLWLICPVLLWWVSRVWLLAHRREMHNDPVLFALKDRQSLIAAVIIALIGVVAGPK